MLSVTTDKLLLKTDGDSVMTLTRMTPFNQGNARDLQYHAKAQLAMWTQNETWNQQNEGEVMRFVQSVVDAISARNIEQLLPLYGSYVDYMDKGNVSQNVIRQDFGQYFARWPVVRWNIDGVIAVKPTADNRPEATFNVDFDVSNPAENRRTIGRAAETWLVAFDPSTNAYRVVAQRERILAKRTVSAVANPNQHPTSERIYQSRPVNPGRSPH